MHVDHLPLTAEQRTGKPLSGPHRKFCEGIAAGLNKTAAYRAAHPQSSYDSARANAAALVANDSIQDEIDRLREDADAMGGSAVLTLKEKRAALASIVRAKGGVTDAGIEVRAGDVVRAIALEMELAPRDSGPITVRVRIGGSECCNGAE